MNPTPLKFSAHATGLSPTNLQTLGHLTGQYLLGTNYNACKPMEKVIGPVR